MTGEGRRKDLILLDEAFGDLSLDVRRKHERLDEQDRLAFAQVECGSRARSCGTLGHGFQPLLDNVV